MSEPTEQEVERRLADIRAHGFSCAKGEDVAWLVEMVEKHRAALKMGLDLAAAAVKAVRDGTFTP